MWGGSGDGGATSFGDPLDYEIALLGGETSTVSVRFSELPVVAWRDLSAEEKRLRGIVGGAGVSFIRAGREIDYGWFLMGGKRKENYDDWWRCEVFATDRPRIPWCLGRGYVTTTVSPILVQVKHKRSTFLEFLRWPRRVGERKRQILYYSPRTFAG